MSGRIVALDDAVPVTRQHLSGGGYQHRADRDFAPVRRRFRFREGECYGFLVSHSFSGDFVLAEDSTGAGERIAKVIARAGICSRRDAERMIDEGRVALNGETVTGQGVRAGEHDVISVDGKPLKEPEPARLWRYHKPAGLVTTHKDPQGRPTVFINLPRSLPRVVSVGRLDFNSEGLLLLTNDGDLARRLELPAGGWVRKYRARLFGKVTQADLDRLAVGLTVGGVKYGPVIADLERSRGVYSWATVSLKEGKNREVKRLMESLGLKVARLIRIQFGPFHLGHLEPGQVEEIPARLWREHLGIGRRKRQPKEEDVRKPWER
jgi:23S rRNA pseudouridine2605 synthase